MHVCHSSMLICHVSLLLSDGTLVGSHWAGGLLQLPQGDTHKLVESWWRHSPPVTVSSGKAEGPGSHPYPTIPPGNAQAGRALGLLPPCGEMGAAEEAVLTSMNHITIVTQDIPPPQRDTQKWALIKTQCLTRCCRNLLKYL